MQQVLSTGVAAALLSVLVVTGCERPPPRGSEADERRTERREAWRKRESERSEDGKVETRDFPVGDFDSLDLRGAAEIQVTVGPPPSVQMTGTARALNAADVKLSGDTLDINFAKGRRWFGDTARLKITITTPTLKELESNGAGDMKLDGLTAGDLDLRLSGAHNVVATGALQELKIDVEGAGNIDFSQVTTTEADVKVNGAGNVEVHVTGELKAEVNGVGAVRYTGDPQKVDSKLHGLGTISRQ